MNPIASMPAALDQLAQTLRQADGLPELSEFWITINSHGEPMVIAETLDAYDWANHLHLPVAEYGDRRSAVPWPGQRSGVVISLHPRSSRASGSGGLGWIGSSDSSFPGGGVEMIDRIEFISARLIESLTFARSHIWTWNPNQCIQCERRTWWIEINYGAPMHRGACTDKTDAEADACAFFRSMDDLNEEQV